MAEEKKPNPTKEFFVQHGEKAGLGVAALALVAYLVFGILLTKEDKSAADLEKRTREVRDDRNREHKDKLPSAPPAYVAKARKPWDEVAAARGANDWIASINTKVTFKEGLAPKVVPLRQVLPEVGAPSIEVALDGVTVTWAAKELSRIEQDKMKTQFKEEKLAFPKLSHFALERQQGDSGKWEPIPGAEKLPAAATNFRDVKTAPRTRYSYRLTAYTDDKDYLKEKTTGLVATHSSASVATLGIWKLLFMTAMKGQDDKGQAFIKIEKFDKDHGKVEAMRIHYVGDKIGWWPNQGSTEPTPKHRLSLGAKAVEIDFDTKMTLDSVEPTKFTKEIQKCKPKITPEGKTGCDRILEKVTIDTVEIVYTDEEGKQVKVFHPDPATDARLRDKLCDEHGGGKIVTTLPGQDPRKPGPGPKEDPAVAKAAKDEADAEKLFQDAEKLEGTDKAGAIKRYEDLISRFSGTQFVYKKRGEITDRIKKLKG